MGAREEESIHFIFRPKTIRANFAFQEQPEDNLIGSLFVGHGIMACIP